MNRQNDTTYYLDSVGKFQCKLARNIIKCPLSPVGVLYPKKIYNI